LIDKSGLADEENGSKVLMSTNFTKLFTIDEALLVDTKGLVSFLKQRI